MRKFHWILLFTAVVFAGSVMKGQVVEAQQPENPLATGPVAPCELPTPAATKTPATDTSGPTAMAPKVYVKDIMNSMLMPAAGGVWNAVATTTDLTGVHESKPETDDQWNAVIAWAAELTETPHLLMIPGRQRCIGGAIPAVWRNDWNRKAREIVEGGSIALMAARKHDADALAEAGERLDVACDQCHERYQLLDDDPTDNNNKVWGTWKPKAGSKAKPAAALTAAPPKSN